MNELRTLIATEAKLLFRDPVTWLAAIALPTAILLIFGSIFGPPEPDPALGGLRFIDVFVPSLIVISVGTLGIQTLPIRLATYREKGVLRRMSTTPAHPLRLLAAQLVIYMVTAVIGLILLVIVARIAFDVPLPRDPIGYVVAFLLGMGSLYAIGLVVASVAPSSRAATAIAIPMFFVVMFLGGVYLPRVFLPEIARADRRLHASGRAGPPGHVDGHDAGAGAAIRDGAHHDRPRDGGRAPLPVGVIGAQERRSAAQPAVAFAHEPPDQTHVGAVRRRDARVGRLRPARARDRHRDQRRPRRSDLAADHPRHRRGRGRLALRDVQPSTGPAHRAAGEDASSSSGCSRSPPCSCCGTPCSSSS